MSDEKLIESVLDPFAAGAGAVVGALLGLLTNGAVVYVMAGGSLPVLIDGTVPLWNYALIVAAGLAGITVLAEWTVGPLSLPALVTATAGSVLVVGIGVLAIGMIVSLVSQIPAGNGEPPFVAGLLAGLVTLVMAALILAVLSAIVSAVATVSALAAKLLRFW